MNRKFMQENAGPFVNFVIFFCFCTFILLLLQWNYLCVRRGKHHKSKYLPSGAGVDRAGLETGAFSDGGGKAGLCPVHAKQEKMKKINKFNIP